jgi:hypothetical protein
MISLLKHHCEKLLLAAMLGAVAAGGAWAWRQQPRLAVVRGEPELPGLAGALPAPSVFGQLPEKTVWAKPPAQSQGGGWLYEVFTPPVIYYHAAARTFAVTPPHYAPAGTAETVFGLELLAVKRAPYRLQLAGYFGAPGDYLAAFVSSEVPQTLLARAGRRFEELGLTLKSFDVRKVAVETDSPGPVYDIAALAVLFDEEAGTEVLLDSRSTKLTDTPLAVFQAPDGKGRPRELQEGDTFSEADATYRIERIQLDPPEVVVARTAPGVPVPETRILRPADTGTAPLAGKAPRGRPSDTRAVRGVATHDR